MDLKPRDAGQGSGRGANLSGEVGEGGDVVAEDRRSVGELRTGQLHAVAGIPGKANGDGIQFLGFGASVPLGRLRAGGRSHGNLSPHLSKKAMMNDECGMMNEKLNPLGYSSFLVHRFVKP